MIVYLVHVRKYIIKKNDANRRFFPVHSPEVNTEILVEVEQQFPGAFQYWALKPDDFENKTKVFGFKNIKKMFDFFEKEGILVGTTLGTFYKVKNDVPAETPPEGVLIYSYKHINIFALRVS